MSLIAEHADRTDGGLRWGVEPICAVLSEHGVPIAPSTYYDAHTAERRPAPQVVRDEQLKDETRRVHAENYRVYGALRPSQFPLLGVLPLAGRPNTRRAVSGRGVPMFHIGA